MLESFGALGESFVYEVVESHNMYRKIHGADPLTLDPELTKASQNCAMEILCNIGEVDHAHYLKDDANIFIIENVDSRRPLTGDEPVTSWYSLRYQQNLAKHMGLYNKSGDMFLNVLVVKDLKYLGVGVVRVRDNLAVVCQYKPEKEEENVK